MTASASLPTPHPGAEPSPFRVELSCECSAVLDFAMEQNGVPVVREVAVSNTGTDALESAQLDFSIAPELSAGLRVAVPRLAPGEEFRMRPVDVPLAPGKLREIVEAERGEVCCRVLHGKRVLAERRAAIRVLAYNEWPGTAAPLGLLAAFVLPNHPVVSVLLQAVREQLRAENAPDALDAYQSGDPKRALKLATALFRAAQTLGIGYVGAPPSFEHAGQKIRLPDQVLADRLGCCLDLSVLLAAALEQMGLAPLLFLVRGHAFVGLWLVDDRFPEGVVEDAARLRTLVDLGQVIPLEATAITSTPPVRFEDAVAAALARLHDDAAFGCAIDVRAVRTEYRPLPVRAFRAPAIEEASVAAPPQRTAAARLLARAAELPIPEERVQAAPPPPDAALRFRRWKEKLLDLTLRNRLLHFRIEGKGALQLEVPDVELLEDGLFAGRSFEVLPRPVSGPGDARDPALARRRVEDAADAQRRDDLLRAVIHTRYAPDELWSRLKHLDREARTALEEGGAAILYLAVGFLRWYETGSSEQPLLAPLLLFPVELSFDPRVRRARFRRLHDDPLLNVTLLEKLRRDFAVDTGALEALPMDGAEGADGGVDVTALVRRFREAVSRIPRWEVLEEAHLGLFHFTKFLMWKDLDDNADRFLTNPVVRRIASRELVALEQEPLVDPSTVDDRSPCELPTVLDADSTQLAALASAIDGKSFVLQGPPGTGKSQTITNIIAATLARGRTVLFVSEKMAALEVVHRRLRDVGLQDFCLELHSHKANKRQVVESLKAALEHGRRTPSDDWPAHGARLAEARADVDRYVAALHRPGPFGASVWDARNRLIELEGAPDLAVPGRLVAGLDGPGLEAARKGVGEFAAVAAAVEPVAEHPFRDATRADWSAAAEEEVRTILGRARDAAKGWQEARGALAAGMGVEAPPSARTEDLSLLARATSLPTGLAPAAQAEWPSTSRRVRAYVDSRRASEAREQELGTRWAPAFLALEHGPLVARFARWASAFFLLAWIMLWSARRRLRQVARGPLPENATILADLRAAHEWRGWAGRLRDESAWAAERIALDPGAPVAEWESALALLDGAHPALLRVREENAACAALVARLALPPSDDRRRVLVALGERAGAAAARLRSVEAELAAFLGLRAGALPSWDEPAHPERFSAVIERWTTNLRSFRGWCLYRRAADQLGAADLAALAHAHGEGVLARDLPHAFERAVLRQWHASAVDADPVLRDFDAEQHGQRVERFRELDRAHLVASRRFVAASVEARLPSLQAAQVTSSEPAIIMREAQKKTRHLPIRRLFGQIPVSLRKLKPCFLMSPLSVAQYLPADAEPFDVVVFDEASQICTHDAIGAIARGRQVIVVGDSRQLPPTSFFTRTEAEDEIPDENDVVELESVLEEAVAKLVPQQWLGWHYRSRHESLIDFSNRHIYENRLEIFPAAAFRGDDVGLHWHRVPDGVYQGGTGREGRTNRREAEALVGYLVEQLKRHAPEDRTFGVVTFNVPQQMLVLDLLDEARLDPEVDRHFTGAEPPFVKNLENVQGDERDEVVFSICSAPDVNGRFSVAVGALNQAGGERRLNVAITRARRKLVVFSSIEPEQIDRSRTKARGVWLLREFLQFARDGRRAVEGTRDARRDSAAIEARIAARLAAEGWQVDSGIGCSAYRLDLAVRDPGRPGRYAVAVESDGASYRSAQCTRDRDRLRADVLRSLGWRVERAWSSSFWFDDRAPEMLVARVRAAIEHPDAPDGRSHAQAPAPAPAPTPAPDAEAERVTPILDGPFATGSASPAAPLTLRVPAHPYRVAALSGPGDSPEAFYAAGVNEAIAAQISAVVDAEAPIHEKLLARRIASHWGIQRLTANPLRRVAERLDALVQRNVVVRRGEFVWPAALDPATYATCREVPSGEEPPREAAFIPPEEIANAAALLLRDAGSLDRDALGREVARVFGIQRMGANVRELVDGGVELLVSSGRAEIRGVRVHLIPR